MANEKNPFSIEYTVGLNYITPAARQKVGVAGNHNVPKLEFSVDPELRSQIQNFAGAENVFFRFDIYNAAGEVFRTESQNVVESEYSDYQFYYKLQERDTRYGGTVKVVLVLTADDGSGNVEEVFCPPALLQFVGKSHGTSKHSYTELEQKVLAAADDAAEAADYARQIKTAYDSGELKGDKGDTGEQGIQGIKGDKGEDGKDYVLTAEDKNEISALVPTHEKYFKIEEMTESGCTISLKPEYRGAARKILTENDSSLSETALMYAKSDIDWAKVGSKNHELPSEIIIPETVNGVRVMALIHGVFSYNDRIKSVTFNPNITVIPNYAFYRTINLEEVKCVEQISTIGKAVFWSTPIKKIEFPNLTTVDTNTFRNCSYLEYVNIGNVDEISVRCFFANTKLQEVKMSQPAITIGDYAFRGCYNLRTLDNIVSPDRTISIGKEAFILSRPTFDWSTLTKCNFGTDAVGDMTHSSDFWKGIPFVPCENKALSFLNQCDLRWQETVVEGTNGGKFDMSCAALSVMGVWCSLNNVNVDDARDFVDICKIKGVNIANIYKQFGTGSNFLTPMGMSCEYIKTPWTKETVENLYNALAAGKYAVLIVASGMDTYDGHQIAVTGITPKGELIVQDTDRSNWVMGGQEHAVGRIPFQNLLKTSQFSDGIVVGQILGKKAVT